MSELVPPEAPVNLLLVDDRPENLVALEAILEPLGQNLVTAKSGEEALRELLHHDFAVILLDVQMPVMDGFETAELIKQRDRTRHIPIVFLTAISKEEQHVFRGYSAGAVDYLFKPFDPNVLRSKVMVLIELYRSREQLKAQAEQLRRQELAELSRQSEERYSFLAESIPQQVWTAAPDGALDYFNQQTLAYFGCTYDELVGWGWGHFLHPDDLPPTVARWTQSLETGEPYEVQFRLRGAEGTYRWHLARAVAMRNDDDEVVRWFGTNTDFDDQKRAEEARGFLLEAGAVLSGSLDYRSTLASVAALAVPHIADWCAIDMLEDDGEIRQLAVAHVDPKKVAFAHELRQRYPPGEGADGGAPYVIRTGKTVLVPEITDEMLSAMAVDDLHLGLIRELGLKSHMCVPLIARDRTLGALSFIAAESGRAFDESDVALAQELAHRAATAVDNAQLYREAEERAQAARVLASVGDGVSLVGADGIVRFWNRGAEEITHLAAADVIGRPAGEAIPGWSAIADRVPVSGGPGQGAVRPESVPLELDGRELWLSISGVEIDDGTVYAFRDMTEERALEKMKSDFVATVSHELRTPLAAIYGAALTIRRTDVELEDELRDRLLAVIAEESNRLANIVNDLLLASNVESDRLQVQIESCDARALVAGVLEAAKVHLPENVTLKLRAPKSLPLVAADPGQLRQVLVNLVDNAIKYSPEGGHVQVKLEPNGRHMRIAVSDDGLGIPRNEHSRIFEKFYRLDPDMNRGIGGTGLGLYICRELVRRVDGRIWVESGGEGGSTFVVEVLLANADGNRARPRQRSAA